MGGKLGEMLLAIRPVNLHTLRSADRLRGFMAILLAILAIGRAAAQIDARSIDQRQVIDRSVNGMDAVGAVYTDNGKVTSIDTRVGNRILTTVYAHYSWEGSGTLVVDSCHVLTAEHVVLGHLDSFDPATPVMGHKVGFYVGQTLPQEVGYRGARYKQFGSVVAVGYATVRGKSVVDAPNDWAIIRLDQPLDSSIKPAAIMGTEYDEMDTSFIVSVAGYPANRLTDVRDQAFKHLLGDTGFTKGVYTSAEFDKLGALYIQNTAQITPGDSGGPVYRAGKPLAVMGLADTSGAQGSTLSREDQGLAVDPRNADSANGLIIFKPSLVQKFMAIISSTPCH
jgi:hypothetical protein